MRRLAQILAVAALAAVMFAPTAADASHAWANYHWERSSNPISLQVGDNVSSAWRTHLTAAVADWNQSTVLDLTEVAGSAKGRCKATDGRIEVCSDSYGPTGWLGVATIYTSGDHITAATTKVNDTYFALPEYDTAAWRQMVMCQEIGHDFGLDHQDENFDNTNLGTCMDYTSDPTAVPDNLSPNQHDYDELAIIYEHLDSSSTGGGGSAGGGGGGCPPKKPGCGWNTASPSDWGQLVRLEGRRAVYERDFGNGTGMVTFVTWAD